MIDFTDQLTDLLQTLRHHEYRTIELHGEMGGLEGQLAVIEEKLNVSSELAHDAYRVVREFLLSRIDGTDDEVEEFIDWQFCRYLSGEPLEDVVADLDKLCDRLANATKVRV